MLSARNFCPIKKKITLTYKNAEYYDEIVDLVDELFLYDFEYLDLFLEHQLKLFFEVLNIGTSIEFIRDGYIINENSLRNEESKRERIHERVFRLCRYYNCYSYINPIGGLNLYDKKLFMREGLKISFIAMKDESEFPIQHNFKPFLSIIDVLMNLGIFNTQKLLNEFELY